MRKVMMYALLLVLAVFLAACGSDSKDKGNDKTDDKPSQEQTDSAKVTEEEKVAEDKVVVKVNEAEVFGVEYNLIYSQAKRHVQQMGEDVKDKEAIKELTIQTLVEQELIKQDAKKEKIEVSAEDVQGELDTIKDENEDGFKLLLEQNGITEEAFKDQLSFTMIYDEYVANILPQVEVSDEEIEEVYEDLKKDNADIPELAEVKDQLKGELAMFKEQEELQLKVEKLREQAEVETLI